MAALFIPQPQTLSIKSNYIAVYTPVTNNRHQERINFTEKSMPKSNNKKRELTKRSRSKLQERINWLYILSECKTVQNNKTGNSFNFKLNFITLTLPTAQMHFDSTITSKCLNSFLTTMRQYHGLVNYIWRAECQSNGNIHYHIVTDSYLHHYVIRNVWNRCLRKLGYIDRYQLKFKGMSFEQYCKVRGLTDANDLPAYKKAWEYGNTSNWLSPNTTDVHSLVKVRNVAAYISKYMTKTKRKKSEDEGYETSERRISGRTWGNSRELSKIRGVQMERSTNTDSLLDRAIKYLKSEVKVEQYYSIVYVNLSGLKKLSIKFYNKIVSFMRDLIGFSPGTVMLKYYKYSST